MQRRLAFFLLFGLIPIHSFAFAEAADPAAGRAQLQLGYALKQERRCNEAIPHFVESVRLDRTAKALLNLADCEESVGKLAAAQGHFAEGRTLASSTGQDELRVFAIKRLEALEKRMPKLSIHLAKGAPADTSVLRDGVELGQVSLNMPLPTDPGPHTIVARSRTLEHKYEVTLAEGATKELEVTPEGGIALSGESAKPDASPPSTLIEQSSLSRGMETESPRDLKTVQYVLLGVGVAGLTIGTIEGARYLSKNSDIRNECPDIHCATQQTYGEYTSLHDSASTAEKVAIIGYSAAAVALVTDAILLLTGSRSRSTLGLRFAPAISSGGAAITLTGDLK